jgi:alkylation response protein AidB-like acyl-CoA dehydrogenase
MDFALSDDQVLLRKEIVAFAQRELNHDVVARDRDHAFSRTLWRKCGEVGLQGMPVPQEYGGSGLDALSTAIGLEALGYGCHDGGLVFGICAHLLACVVPIWKHGTEAQKRRYLPGLSDGTFIAVNAMTESGSGSDAFGMRARAERDGSGFRLNAVKTFSSNGPVADVALVYAITDPAKGHCGGLTAFIVDAGTPGFQVGQTFEKMGLRTCPIGELVFDNVFLPDEAVLGGVGAGTAIFAQSMDWERVCLVASHVGTMERLLEKAVEYARTRTAFGQPVGRFQAVSHSLADMKVRLEAARLLTQRSAWRLDRSRDVAMDASITKLFVSESLVQTALDTVQVFGGYGFTVDYEIERALRDAVGSTLYSGTSEIQRNIIARWLGL